MRGHRLQKQIIFTIFLVLALTGMCDVSLNAEETETEAASKVVRVGWFDSSFCYYDPFSCGGLRIRVLLIGGSHVRYFSLRRLMSSALSPRASFVMRRKLPYLRSTSP